MRAASGRPGLPPPDAQPGAAWRRAATQACGADRRARRAGFVCPLSVGARRAGGAGAGLDGAAPLPRLLTTAAPTQSSGYVYSQCLSLPSAPSQSTSVCSAPAVLGSVLGGGTGVGIGPPRAEVRPGPPRAYKVCGVATETSGIGAPRRVWSPGGGRGVVAQSSHVLGALLDRSRFPWLLPGKRGGSTTS